MKTIHYLLALFSMNLRVIFALRGTLLAQALFSIVPAGLISFGPAQAIRESDSSALLPVFLGAGVFGLAAIGVFHLGLRRYSSGSGFGHAN